MEISLPYTWNKNLNDMVCKYTNTCGQLSIVRFILKQFFKGCLTQHLMEIHSAGGNSPGGRREGVVFSWYLTLTLCSSPPRASAACSALWKLSGCSVWGEWPGSWTTTLNTELRCWSCWCVCSDWLLTGWPAFGTALGTMRSSMRTPRRSATTAGSTNWPWTLALLTSLMGPAQGSGKVVPARIPFTSPHCISPWPASPAWALGTSPHPQTSRRSLQWPSWWLAVSMKVGGAGVGGDRALLFGYSYYLETRHWL